jgi:hypothetical protein
VLKRIGQIVLLLVAGVAAARLVMAYTDKRTNPLVSSGRWLGCGQRAK